MGSLDDNPARKVKIGANLSRTVENNLIECWRANSDLFSCSPKEMSGIDPEARRMSQKRCHQSTKKAQAAREIVEGLLHTKFISEINYT